MSNPTRWSVDEKSYELAEHFAQGENCNEAELRELSQLIQDTVESFFSARSARDTQLISSKRRATTQPEGALEPVYTAYDPKPIPMRDHDWCAYYDSYEPGAPLGWGASEQLAVNDLLEQTVPA